MPFEEKDETRLESWDDPDKDRQKLVIIDTPIYVPSPLWCRYTRCSDAGTSPTDIYLRIADDSPSPSRRWAWGKSEFEQEKGTGRSTSSFSIIPNTRVQVFHKGPDRIAA